MYQEKRLEQLSLLQESVAELLERLRARLDGDGCAAVEAHVRRTAPNVAPDQSQPFRESFLFLFGSADEGAIRRTGRLFMEAMSESESLLGRVRAGERGRSWVRDRAKVFVAELRWIEASGATFFEPGGRYTPWEAEMMDLLCAAGAVIGGICDEIDRKLGRRPKRPQVDPVAPGAL